MLERAGISADALLVDRVLEEIQAHERATKNLLGEQAESDAPRNVHLAPRACPSSESRGRVPGVLEEVLGDFGGELQLPTPSAKLPLRSPEAVLAKLRSARLKRRLGIADLQSLGDVSGDGRLTCAELGKVLKKATRRQ